MPAPRSFLDSATIVLFALALLAPAADQCLRPDKERDCEEHELRTPEPRPSFPARLAEVASFPRRYESHYLDTFGLRDVLLRWNGIEKWLGCEVLTASNWEAGREGWCFYGGGDSRAVHRGLKPFSTAELDGWVKRLRERRDLLARRGVRYLFVICPNKETIYPEFVSPSWAPLGPTRMEQLVQRLEREGDLPFLDLRPALLEAKEEDRPGDWLYPPLGTHWNGRGTYAAYAALIARLQPAFPALTPVRREDCERIESKGRGDGIASQLYIDDLVHEHVYSLHPAAGKQYRELARSSRTDGARVVTQKEGNAPRLLWVHDSFGPYLQPLVCESFAFVHSHWSQLLLLDDVDAAKPDLVLETYVERTLAFQEPYMPIQSGVSVWVTQFEGSKDVLWREAADGSFPPAQGLGGTTLERRDGRLQLARHGPRDGLLLPALEATVDAPVLLRLAATCAVPTDVDVFVRSAGSAQFLTRDSVSLALATGESSAVVRLPFVGSPFETLLRPRALASALTIDALELRRGVAPAR